MKNVYQLNIFGSSDLIHLSLININRLDEAVRFIQNYFKKGDRKENVECSYL